MEERILTDFTKQSKLKNQSDSENKPWRGKGGAPRKFRPKRTISIKRRDSMG